MQNSSPSPANHPSTPGHSRKRYPSLSIQTYQPIHSSPLAESPKSSPVISAQRRKSSYKTGLPLTSPFSIKTGSSAGTNEEPQKAFLRERLRARCIERAKKDREKARGRVTSSRSSDGSASGGSSDGDAEMDSEEEEVDEDTMMQDEVRVSPYSDTIKFKTYQILFFDTLFAVTYMIYVLITTLTALSQNNGKHFP